VTSPEMFDYLGSSFEVRSCFGGFSCTIWEGERQNQSKELGLYQTQEAAILACCKWIEKRTVGLNGRH